MSKVKTITIHRVEASLWNKFKAEVKRRNIKRIETALMDAIRAWINK